MKIVISHDGFHGCTSRTIDVSAQPGERVQLSESQVKKLARAGCGMSDCTCGESILTALMRREDSNWFPGELAFVTMPASGSEISVRGNYPQNR